MPGPPPTADPADEVSLRVEAPPERLTSKALLGGFDEHEQELRDGMRHTLERLKAVAEAG